MIDYIREYGNDTFDKRPLCEIDSLILSQFSYLKFDRLVSGLDNSSHMVDIQTLWHDKDYESLYADERFRGENTELFLTMVQSTRFGSLKMNNYVNHIDREQETQFSAITFLLGTGSRPDHECGLFESNVKADRSSFLCGRTFQRRQSGGLCSHEL